MNLQNLMKQAQSMQKNLVDSKKEIEKTIYEGNSELVDVTINGKKEVLSVKIKDMESFDKSDVEILEDMIVIAMNNAINKVNEDTKKKMGNQVGPFGDLF